MAEHHKAIQPLFLVQLMEAEQGPQGFAGPWAGVDQHIGPLPSAVYPIGDLLAKACPQQLDQLALPLPGLQPQRRQRLALGCTQAEVKGGGSHHSIVTS